MTVKKFWLGMVGVVVLLTGCVALNKAMSSNEFVYDKSIPKSEMAQLILPDSVRIFNFDGNPVMWYGPIMIYIPAGKHSFDISPIPIKVDKLSSGTEIITYRSDRDRLPVSFVSKPGHRYNFSAWQLPSSSTPIITIKDRTYFLNEMWGDTIIIPKESSTPTLFEGIWRSTNNIVFTFAGNTWQSQTPPNVWENGNDWAIVSKGTFEYADDKITMYYKIPLLGSRANVYEYTLVDGNMTLEVIDFLPKTTFKKQEGNQTINPRTRTEGQIRSYP